MTEAPKPRGLNRTSMPELGADSTARGLNGTAVPELGADSKPRGLHRTSMPELRADSKPRRLTRASIQESTFGIPEFRNPPSAYPSEDIRRARSVTSYQQYTDRPHYSRSHSTSEMDRPRRHHGKDFSPYLSPRSAGDRNQHAVPSGYASKAFPIMTPIEDYDSDDDMGRYPQALAAAHIVTQNHADQVKPDYDVPRGLDLYTQTPGNITQSGHAHGMEPAYDSSNGIDHMRHTQSPGGHGDTVHGAGNIVDMLDNEELRHKRLLESTQNTIPGDANTAQPSQDLRKRLAIAGVKNPFMEEHTEETSTIDDDSGQINPGFVHDEETGASSQGVAISVRRRKVWCIDSEIWKMTHGVTANEGRSEKNRTTSTEHTESSQTTSLNQSVQPKSGKSSRKRCFEFDVAWAVWKGALREIEGHFGSAVLAYFRFLKWLFWLNLLLAITLLCLIMVPQEFLPPNTFPDTIQNISDAREENDYLALSIDNSVGYESYLNNISRGIHDDVLDFFQGTGWMESTVLFYGYYFNKPNWNGYDNKYDLSLAYLLTVLAYFLCTLFAMVRYTAHGMKERIVSEPGKFYKYFNKVLCSWDFNLSNKEKIHLAHRRLLREFKGDYAALMRKDAKENMKTSKLLGIVMTRICINVVVIAILAGSLYLIVYVSRETMTLMEENQAFHPALSFFVQFLPSITLTGLNTIAPFLFNLMITYEKYTPDNELKINIFRCVFLRLSSVFTLIMTLSIEVSKFTDTGFGGEISNASRACSATICWCWETYVGQQFYKLVLVDFIVVCAFIFLVEFPRSILVAKFGSENNIFDRIGKQEFQIPKNVLDLVYSQTICWIGAVFSPLIPAITVAKFLIYFYVKKLTLLRNCVPTTRPYRASNTNSFFMVVLLVSFVLCCFPVLYTMTSVTPSKGCGPFRVHSGEGFVMWTAFTDALERVPSWFKQFMQWIQSIYVIVTAFIVVGLTIFYFIALASGYRRKINNQREKIAQLISDKQFLLNHMLEKEQR